MEKQSFRFPVGLITCFVAIIALHLYGQNGTPYYFDINSTTAGFGGPASGTYYLSYNTPGWWNSSSAGTNAPGAFPAGAQITFGNASSDFSGNTFTLAMDLATTWNGIVINSNNANITLNGSATAYLTAGQTWTVAAGSTLNEAVTWNSRGLDFNFMVVTLAGGGTINFNTAIGINDNNYITENGSGLVVNLNSSGAGLAQGTEQQASYTLTNGTLNFHVNNPFNRMRSADNAKFTINGGTIDNTSGSPMTLDMYQGTFAISNSFTFTGTDSLNFGTNAVALSTTPTITVSNNTLTMGGVVSGGYGITKAGNGTLLLTGANTYSGTTTINNGTVKIQGVAFMTTPRTYSISSNATLNIDGGSDVALGTTTINGAGILSITGGNVKSNIATGHNITMSLGSGGLINVASGGTLTNGGYGNITWTSNLADLNVDGTFDVWDGANVTVDALTGGGTITKGWTSAGVLITVGANNGSGTYSGIIDSNSHGPISLTKSGSGTQTLSGANNYKGTTTLSAGTLNINNASAIGTGTFTITGGGIDNTSGGNINTSTSNAQNWNGDFSWGGTNNLYFVGGGSVTLGGNRIITANGTADLDEDGTISGAYSLTKAGTGTLELSGVNNAYTGGTTLSAGNLWIGSATAIPGTGTFTINGGAIDNSSVGALTLSANPSQAWNGDFTFTGTNSLNLGTGAVLLSANRIVTVSASNLTVGGIISGSGKSLTLAGSGSLTLSGVNTYSGGTTISGPDTLYATNSSALGSGAVSLTASASPYSNLLLGNGVTVTNALTLNSASSGSLRSFLIVPSGATATYNGAITLSGDYKTGFNTAGTMTIGASGDIGNSSFTGTFQIRGDGTGTIGTGAVITIPNANLEKTDNSTWTISSTGNNWGNTNIFQGTLKMGVANALPSATVITMGQSGNFSATWDLNGYSQTIAGLTEASGNTGGANAMTVTNSGVAATLTINNSSDCEYDSLITNGANALNLVKTGSGGLTLGGHNTYTGTTAINGGTLYITNATTAGAGGTGNGGAVTVASGATLGGTGEVRGNVTVSAGGSLSPGTTGNGQLKIVGNLALTNSTSTISINLSGATLGQYDQIYDTGTVNLAGATLSLSLGFTPTNGQTFTIIDNDGADAITGTPFSGLPEGDTFAVGSCNFIITYVGGTGNDIVLKSYIPTENLSNWAYSKNLNLNTTPSGANVMGNVTQFPVLVRLTSSNFNFAQAQDAGGDIRFAKSNGVTLYYTIEQWDRVNQVASVWVNVDTVYGNNGTQYFTMYWGNSAAASLDNSNAVFDTANGFAGVWHLNTSGTGKRPDATVNKDSAKVHLGSASSQFTQAGLIGGCDTFVAANAQYDSVANGPNLVGKSFTVSAWAKLAVTPVADQFILAQGALSADNGLHFGYSFSAGGKYTFRFYSDDLDQTSAFNGGAAWHFITGTFNVTNDTQVLYYDGTRDNARKANGSYSGTGSLKIGTYIDGSTNYFNGDIDEVVVSKTTRSPDWIKLCYQNQQANQTLVDFDDYSKWAFSRNITINTTTSQIPSGGLSANVLSFPYLVRLNSTTNFNFTQAQSSGKDIRFSKSDGTHLYYQIEHWNSASSADSAEIWVRIDTIYSNNSTQYITMYWGNASAASRSDSNDVFQTSNGFVGVWHLGNDPTKVGNYGIEPDATANALPGHTLGAITSANLVSGVVGNGINLSDGSSDRIVIPNIGGGPIDITGHNPLTMSVWVKWDAIPHAGGIYYDIFKKGDYQYGIQSWADSSVLFGVYDGAGNHPHASSPHATASASTWHLFTGVYKVGACDSTLIYVDGQRKAATGITVASSGISAVNNDSLSLGYANVNYNTAIVDEAVLSNVQRDSNWIKLCYYNELPTSTMATVDSADAFRPLSIKRNAGMDTVIVSTTRWGIKFLKSKGGGVGFLGPDTVAADNQLDSNMFCLLYKGERSDTNTGTLTMLDSSTVFMRIRQQKTVASQPFTIDYTVLGSGKMYARVTTLNPVGSSNLSGGLEFRVANNNTASTYRNVKYGASASSCQAVLHADTASGKFDLLMAPYDVWTQANSITTNSRYEGIKSSTWSLVAGNRQTWNFMIDFSHKTLHDSATAWKYINDYQSSDTLGWFTGTPLLEKSWEDMLWGHWKLDEQGGDTAGDASSSASGLGNFGSVRGGGKWRSGMWGNADSLDGSDSITVKPGTPSLFNGGNSGRGFTILGWVRPTTALSASTVLFQQMVGTGATATGYQLTGATGGKLLLTLGNGTALVTLQGKTALNTGTWYHVGAEMTWSRDTMKLYVNGIVDTMFVGSWSGYPAATGDSLDMGKGLNGELDDMRFYGEALSDQQVKAIYLKGYSPDRGVYSVRADNNGQVQCLMHGANVNRNLPVFQIANYWSATPPTKVYVDSQLLTSGADYYSDVDQSIRTLSIGFNRTINANSTIFVGNSAIGQTMMDTMPQMYWGQATVGGSPHVWVKNFPGNYFGSSTSGNFFFDWKMTYNNHTNTKNGELWYYASSVTSPSARLDTTANTNNIPGYSDGTHSESFGNMNLCNGGCPISSQDVPGSYTYSIAESSSVRVLLNVNTRSVVSTSSYKIDTRWAIYPTGQIWRWDSISYLSANPTAIYGYDFLLDTTNDGSASAPTVTCSAPKTKLRAGFHSSKRPDFVVAMMSLKNNTSTYALPYTHADTMSALAIDKAYGVQFDDPSGNTMWNATATPIIVGAYVDVQRTPVVATYIDSIGASVQHFLNPALTMLNGNGTLNKTSWGDINQDGFSEGEGAYVIAATNNTVQFTVLTHNGSNDTCRYNPAFRITGYTSATVPQYVMVGGVLKTPNYGYNIYLNKAKQEVVLQLNQIICTNTDVYISYDKTLAVTMTRFNAMPGDRNDTLRWRTESEDQNLGFNLYRRIKPAFMDSMLAVNAKPDADTDEAIVSYLRKGVVKQEDTMWVPVNTGGIVKGAAQGKSYGPRNYGYIDYRVLNDIRYEYRIEAVDYTQNKDLYKDYAEAMPRRIVPAVFDLSGNYPNPFRSLTTIRYALPVKTKVDLYVYNIQGRLVRKLLYSQKQDAGFYRIGWDGKDDRGLRVASGPYIYRMNTPQFVKSKLMIFAK